MGLGFRAKGFKLQVYDEGGKSGDCGVRTESERSVSRLNFRDCRLEMTLLSLGEPKRNAFSKFRVLKMDSCVGETILESV